MYEQPKLQFVTGFNTFLLQNLI